MIEFVTLLLGLVVGPRQVELSVQDPVAAVEILLDGNPVGRLSAAPWALEVDFGPGLRPHRLDAIAYDLEGRPTDAAEQIVNYSRSSFEAALVLDPTSDLPERRGRVIWEGAIPAPPREIELLFDTQSLEVDPDGSFSLPPYNPESVHLLEATVTFADRSVGRATMTLGGDFIDATSTTLTAIPLTLPEFKPWPRQQALNWLEAGGKPVKVFSVETRSGRLVVVRDHRLERNIRAVIPGRDYLVRSRYRTSANLDYDVVAVGTRPLAKLPGTFSMSAPAPLQRRFGLRQIVLHEGPLVPEKKHRKLTKEGQRLWDALAVAGLQATRANRPRAVLLMIGRQLTDESSLEAPLVRDYLHSIHVPLLIWAPDRSALEQFGLGGTERVFLGEAGLVQIEIEAGRVISSQALVWLDGDYLPTEVSLSSAAPAGIAFPD